MGLKELSVGRSDIFRVDPRILKIEVGWNVRQEGPDKEAHIRFLANSIKAVGVRVPLLIRVEENDLFVVAGECRLRGAMLAISEGVDIKSVPVIAEGRYSNPQDRVVSMLIENEGMPLTMLEQGEAYKRLLGHGWTEAKIGESIGRSVTHVKTALNLTTISPEILTMVKAGTVTPTLAMKVIAEKGPEKAIGALKDAVEVSSAQGKTRATAKHLDRNPDIPDRKTTNWKKYGPLFKAALENICSTPINSPKIGDAIAAGNELLSQFDDD